MINVIRCFWKITKDPHNITSISLTCQLIQLGPNKLSNLDENEIDTWKVCHVLLKINDPFVHEIFQHFWSSHPGAESLEVLIDFVTSSHVTGANIIVLVRLALRWLFGVLPCLPFFVANWAAYICKEIIKVVTNNCFIISYFSILW